MLVFAVLWAGVTLVLGRISRRHVWASHAYRDSIALGILAVATAAFFWPLLSSSQVWMPVGGGDLVSFLYPVYQFAARSLRLGELALWNPYLYGGAPFVGDNQSGLLYPLNLLTFVLRPSLDFRTMELLAVFHFFVAGVAAYYGLRYMQRDPIRRWAALAGAVAFMFSDLFVTHFGNLNMIACAAWLPLVFCLFRRALDETDWRFAVGSGLVFGVAALAGHIQPLLYIAFALGLYFLCHLYAIRNRGGRRLLLSIVLLALVAAVGVGMAAPTLLPAYEMSKLSLRSELSYEQASQYSLPPVALVGLLFPDLFGRGPGGFWGSWSRVEVGYAGIVTVLLAVVAFWLRRDRFTLYLALLAAVALLLAMGDYTLLHGLAYRFFPGFDMVRAPARMIVLLDLALAGLAALALDQLLRPISYRDRGGWRRILEWLPVAVACGALVVLALGYAVLMRSQTASEAVWDRLLQGIGGLVLGIAFLLGGIVLLLLRSRRRISSNTLGLLLVSLMVLDLASLGSDIEVERRNPLSGFDHPAAIAYLKQDQEYFRIDTRTEVWDVWQPDLSLLHGIFDVWGIHNPLVLADYNRYWEGLGSRTTPLYDFLNAKYVVAHKDVVLDWDKFELAFDGDPQVNIYRNDNVLPRAYVVYQAWRVANQEEAYAAIHRAEFDPATTVVVEGGSNLGSSPAERTPASIVSYANNEIRLRVAASQPGYLIMSEVYYPGWKAEVDGEVTTIVRGNYAFRAILLSEGDHEVRLFYQPASWRIGLVLCGAVGLILLVALLAGVPRSFGRQVRSR